MSFGRRLLSALGTGVVAAIGTTAAVAAMGRRETGSSAAAINATSHIVWGEEAAEQDEVSARYTLTGALLNLGAIVGWAAVQEAAFGRWARRGSPTRALVSGAATSAIAYVTDYKVVPKRLTPGVEKRLSKPALLTMYAVLAVTLAAGVRQGSD